MSEQPAPARINPRLLVLLALPILGVIGAFVTLLASNPAGNTSVPPVIPTQQESRLINRTAPNFELATLDGEDTVRLSSLLVEWSSLISGRPGVIPAVENCPLSRHLRSSRRTTAR